MKKVLLRAKEREEKVIVCVWGRVDGGEAR